MAAPKYLIAGLSAYPDEFKNFMEPLLVGAKALGHEVFGLIVGQHSQSLVLDQLRRRKPHFCLMTGRTVGGLLIYFPALLRALRDEAIPLVFLWYDNPLRYTWTLTQAFRENVLLLTTVDTQCIPELQAFGIDRVVYSPFIVGPAFRPLPPSDALRCEMSFCGGYMTQAYLEGVYIPRNYQLPELARAEELAEKTPSLTLYRQAITGFVEERQRTKQYVDVFEYLRARSPLCPGTKQFDKCSNLLMHYQKTLEREHLFDAVSQSPMGELRVYGGADANLDQQETMRSRWPNVQFHPALERNTVFPALFTSTDMNLGVSQFARAVHGRYLESAACGGFMIAEYKADMEREFEIGKEIVCFRSWDEMRELIRFYRQHDTERRQIGAQAREGHLQRRTARHRLQALMPAIGRELQRFRDTAKVAV